MLLMDKKWHIVGMSAFLGLTTLAQTETQTFDFNDFEVGQIDGQMEWNVYNKVKDSSAISIMDVLGTSEENGDKALVVRPADIPIRCVTGEPIRWLPGRTLSMEFDFKVAVAPLEVVMPKPVVTVMIGNSLLSDKASWQVRLEASPRGDWVLIGAMPDGSSQRIYGENFLIRSERDVSISEWYRFKLVSRKLSEPDSFETTVEISSAETDEQLAEVKFSDGKKDKLTKTMWNTSRAHVGFGAEKNQLGLVCIDNLVINSFKE
jgi:hypothetical protein